MLFIELVSTRQLAGPFIRTAPNGSSEVFPNDMPSPLSLRNTPRTTTITPEIMAPTDLHRSDRKTTRKGIDIGD